MLIREVTDVIERFAPLAWQESYDNAGLIVGRPDDEVHRALLAVDVTDEVMAEAEREGCDMVITHHPIVFHALKRFNSADQVQRCVERAIRGGIALYACHTNLDSAPGGMSWRLAEMLGVQKSTVQQLVRAGEFGPTVNVARKHLVTEDGLAEFIARRTGPAHSGLAPAPQTNYHHRHSDRDPGPI